MPAGVADPANRQIGVGFREVGDQRRAVRATADIVASLRAYEQLSRRRVLEAVRRPRASQNGLDQSWDVARIRLVFPTFEASCP